MPRKNIVLLSYSFYTNTFASFRYFSLSSKYKPKCLWQGVCAIGELLKVTTGWSILEAFCENIISWACLDKSGLKDIFHWYALPFLEESWNRPFTGLKNSKCLLGYNFLISRWSGHWIFRFSKIEPLKTCFSNFTAFKT